MNCKNCDYALWNIKARQCPECGTPFRPSEYEFVINSVQFCCPHCEQAYYGNGAAGHLVPDTFACVRCGNPVTMDDMLLRPTSGVEEHRTRVAANPWLQRRRHGFFKCWMATIGRALVQPYRLMRETPLQSSVGEAWWFAILTAIFTWLVAVVPVMCFVMIPIASMPTQGPGGAGGPGMGAAAAGMGMGVGFMLLFGLAGTVLGIALNGLVAHGLLRITGGTAAGLGRTYQAMCYASGANAISAIPCFGGYVGWIWWLVSSVLTVKEAQRVSGGRASFAVLTLPIVSVVGFVGLYVLLIVSLMAGMGAAAGGRGGVISQRMEVQMVTNAMLSYAASHDGQAPVHGAQLVASGDLGSNQLVALNSATFEEDVPIGDIDLEQLSLLPRNRRNMAAQAAADALPADVVAHRVGDFVFMHHGIDLSNADPGLWIMALWPDPDINPPPSRITVGLADGSTQFFPTPIDSMLRAQNRLRQQYGLPPLPHPSAVTHGKPATGG